MAFNEDTSFIEYNVEQPTQDFVTNFNTIGGTTDVVLVTVDGVLTDTPESLYTVQQINHTTWRVTPEVQPDSVVRLYRVTDLDQMMHVFTAGAKFIARNMDSNFKQIRHSQQEVRDAFDYLEYNTLGVVEAAKSATELANTAAQYAEQTANDAAAQVDDKIAELQPAIDSKLQEFDDAINTIVVNDGVPALAVSDASGLSQQQWNNGVESIADLLAIPNPKDGSRVFVKGLQGGWFEYNESKAAINNGGTVFNGWVRYTLETITKPEWFGSPRNGVDDDAEGIRKAIAHIKTRGGGRLFFTKDTNSYQMKSVDVNNSAFTLDSSDITLEFETDQTGLSAQIEMGSICYINDSIDNFNIIGGRFSGNGLATFCLNTNPLKYSPLISITRTAFNRATDVCLSLQTYVGNLTLVKTFGGKTGIKIRAVSGNIVTSLTLSSCYTNNYTEVGYDIAVACYCSLISCASDNSPNGIAYKLNMRGGALIGCGAEHVKQPIQFVSFRGVSIQGFYCQRVGTKDPLNPQPYLIEFVSGQNATLAGLLIEVQTGYYYDKKVAVTSATYGSECVTVTDYSVKRDEISFVTNWEFGTRPIKLLLGDETQKNTTISISSMDELREYISTYLTEYKLNHTLTIQLANGAYNFGVGTIDSTLNKLTGAGEIIIQGNSSDRTLVKLETEYNKLVVKDCTAKVRFKNLTISGTVSNNANERLIVNGSKNVVLDNVLISKNGINVGYGVHAINGAVVHISNGTSADSSAFASAIFGADASSKFVFDRAATAPTGTRWTEGMYAENSSPTTHIGWVFSGGAWKTYGAIT